MFQAKNWEEAAQSLLYIAALVTEYLYSKDTEVQMSRATYQKLAPNILKELPLQVAWHIAK